MKKEKWNENVETCEECHIQWKKINQQCPVCYRRNKNDIKFVKPMTPTNIKGEEMKQIIKKGDKIIVDRSLLGKWIGKVTYIRSYGWALGIDCFGIIETDLGEKHSFDSCVHRLIKL